MMNFKRFYSIIPASYRHSKTFPIARWSLLLATLLFLQYWKLACTKKSRRYNNIAKSILMKRWPYGCGSGVSASCF
ncbi:hypothetical protein HOY82DRAFT_574317 [Tuber indicum]|nr:hypothetical protein HOY82DRAFT_574317 [Tuber indicum]